MLLSNLSTRAIQVCTREESDQETELKYTNAYHDASREHKVP